MLAKARQERLKTPHAAEVSDAESYVWIKGRAKSFASLGVDRKDIDTLLAHQAIKFCEGGKAVFEADKWKKRFHKLAFDPKLVIGHAVRQGPAGYYDKDNKLVPWDHTPLKPPSTHSILVGAMLTYPDLIWADDMYRKIEKLRPDYITRDKRGDLTTTAKRRAGRAGDEAGYVPEQPPGHKGRWRWVRNVAGFTGVAPLHSTP